LAYVIALLIFFALLDWQLFGVPAFSPPLSRLSAPPFLFLPAAGVSSSIGFQQQIAAFTWPSFFDAQSVGEISVLLCG